MSLLEYCSNSCLGCVQVHVSVCVCVTQTHTLYSNTGPTQLPTLIPCACIFHLPTPIHMLYPPTSPTPTHGTQILAVHPNDSPTHCNHTMANPSHPHPPMPTKTHPLHGRTVSTLFTYTQSLHPYTLPTHFRFTHIFHPHSSPTHLAT